MDINDLTNKIARGRTVTEIASCRDEDEVREKMKERDLAAHPRKRSSLRLFR
jgi:hypothetical protein